MALADTAKLVASLELQDKFSKNADKFNQAVGGMERRVSTFGRISSQVGSGISTGVANLQRLALVGVGVIGANVAAGIQSLQRLEEVTVATNAVIESTGGVAGVTAEEVRRLAEEFESLNATMDDKVIQSAENLLLTFTKIGEDTFPQALEAALNMNQALGGGEEGLQSTIIQVGKALQDPIRGITALRRVGVSFTSQQQDQIKTLVEANDLFAAQTLILKELETEFGGQFAAAGTTATANFAKFKDAIEDAQMALATAFLPVLEKVTDKLTTLLADPATTAAITEVGENLADAFDSLVEVAGNLPWDAIGNTFRIMGTGSKALLDAFVSMPPWVQTAVLTGWGLNKLTGGALTGIAGTIVGALTHQRGSTPANPLFVSAVGGGLGGGAPAAGGGRVGGALQGLAIATGIGAIAVGLHQLANEQDVIGEWLRSINSKGEKQGQELTKINRQQGAGFTSVTSQAARVTAARSAEHARTLQTLSAANVQRQQVSSSRAGEAARLLQTQAAALGQLQAIAGKNFSPLIKVGVTSNVTISEIQRRITSQQIAIGRGFQEF